MCSCQHGIIFIFQIVLMIRTINFGLCAIQSLPDDEETNWNLFTQNENECQIKTAIYFKPFFVNIRALSLIRLLTFSCVIFRCQINRNNEKRKEKSRDAARCRRSRETEIFTELGDTLPVRKDELENLDKSSVMRLAIATLKIEDMLQLCEYAASFHSFSI